jgi:hypothetical protein
LPRRRNVDLACGRRRRLDEWHKSGLGEADLIRATLVAVVVAPFDNWGSGIVLARSPSSTTP